jgi:hypothetical protein
MSITFTPAIPTHETETAAVHPNGAQKMKLFHEALSRARTRRPQDHHTPEAHRNARALASQARLRAARELGGRPF